MNDSFESAPNRSTLHRGVSIARFACISVCASSLLLISCGQDESTDESTTVNEREQTADDATNLTAEIENFRDNMRRQIAQFNRQIQLLDDRAADIPEETREIYNATMENLREQRDELELELVEFEVSTRAAWSEFRAGLESSERDLTDAIAEAIEQFGSTEM